MDSRLDRIAKLHDRLSQEGYSEYAEGEAQYGIPELMRTITEQEKLPQASWSVLDLGCGPGNLKDFSKFKTYTGVDISPEMIGEAGQRGYNELIEADIASYAESPMAQPHDAVVALSAAYFIPSNEIIEFIKNVDRLAAHFWMITLDGISQKLIDIYRREDQIDVYNHQGIRVPWTDVKQETIKGWYSPETEEYITMEVLYRIK